VKNGAQQRTKQPTITPTVFAAFVSRFSDLSCAGMMAMCSLEKGDERPRRLTWLPARASVDCARRTSCDDAVERLDLTSTLAGGGSPSAVTTMRGRLKSPAVDKNEE